MKFENYIFDLDGTLLDTIEDLAISCNYALAKYDMPNYSLEQIKSFVGNGVKKLLERSVPGGSENPMFEQVNIAFREHYLEHNADHTKPYPGVEEMIGELARSGKKIAVVSNKFDKATKHLVEQFFGNDIKVAVGESPVLQRKPAPDMVFEALRQLKGKVEQSVYIGDSDVDVMTARNCGMPCISVLWGFRNKKFLIEHGADTFVNAPEEILHL